MAAPGCCGEAKMRRTLAILALIAASSSPVAPQLAAAQQPASVAACVAAANTHDALWRCKGVVAGPCIDTPGGETTAGMVQCNMREAEEWQALIAVEIYRLNAEDASRSDELDSANDAWAAWGVAECEYQASAYEGGSLARVVSAACFADITADRVIALTWARRNAVE
jgi:uncharacterized protein YecT (DUF1311 family)